MVDLIINRITKFDGKYYNAMLEAIKKESAICVGNEEKISALDILGAHVVDIHETLLQAKENLPSFSSPCYELVFHLEIISNELRVKESLINTAVCDSVLSDSKLLNAYYDDLNSLVKLFYNYYFLTRTYATSPSPDRMESKPPNASPNSSATPPCATPPKNPAPDVNAYDPFGSENPFSDGEAFYSIDPYERKRPEHLFEEDAMSYCMEPPDRSPKPILPRVVPSKRPKFSFFKKKKPPLTTDSVQFSAVTTESIKAGEYLPIHVIMYEDDYRCEVDELLSAMPGKGKEVKSGYQQVERASDIKVILTSPDVDIHDGFDIRTWQGKYIEFCFSAYIPQNYEKKQALFCATVYVNDIIFSKLRFTVTTEPEQIAVTRQSYNSGFMSYSSEDRNRVAAILQGMHKARPDMDIFFDVEKLRSGADWQNELRTEIEKRDVLFLCWSQNAKNSEWVDREWRYAYELRGEDAIEPIPIDSPKSCPPPAELKNKHFNDMLLYVINSKD